MRKVCQQLSSSQIIIIGFAAMILVGSFLLMTPFATKDGQGAAFLDALFTATSAACVTGLVVRDTATYWTGFGQAVILALIQVGGMGVITFTVVIFKAAGRKISLRQQSIMQDAISVPKLGSVIQIIGFLVTATAAFEIMGAFFLAPVFCGKFGLIRGSWYSLFHSVSAFCNAGFDLMGNTEPFSSLTSFVDHPVVNLVIMLLIVIGGIGFMTWQDVRVNRLRLRHYQMQSKAILVTTALLIVLPAVYFFLFEFADLPFGQRLWGSLFQSVTARTAGFNTLDMNLMSEGGQSIMILLMLTGGAPGSTAGGLKVTTLTVMIATAVSVFRHKKDTDLYGRRVEEGTVRNAMAIVSLYLFLFLSGGFLISRIEGLPLLVCLFESASAVGTAGLTLGITTQLGVLSHMILIFLMYSGRVGALTLVFATLSGGKSSPAKLPSEKVMVG